MTTRTETNQVGLFQRDLQIERFWSGREEGEGDKELRQVEVSFSSEEPYLRAGWFDEWVEILDHKPKSVRLDRIRSIGISLFNHDTDQVVAKPVKVWLENGRGKAVLRFGRTDRANEIWQLIEDGILTGISVWYRIYKRELEVEEEGKPPVYRVTDWEPIEIGPVSVPADATVGIGRDGQDDKNVCITCRRMEVTEMSEANVEVVNAQATAEGISQERQRAAKITLLGEKFGEQKMAAEAVASGTPLETFRGELLEKFEKRQVQPGHDPLPDTPPARKLGMGRREVKGFSFLRLLAAMSNPHDRRAMEAARGEMEACEAWGQVIGRTGGGMMIPPEVWKLNSGRRALDDATEGADLTPTMHDGGNFIDVLRATRPVMAKATTLGGLTGDLLIPRKTAGATALFKAETTVGVESTPTFDQILLTPHKLTAWTEMSKQAMIQFSPDVENLVRADLFEAAMDKLEGVLIDGGGTAEPSGILDESGVGSVTVGGTGLSWENVVNLEAEVNVDNALIGDLAYLTNALVVGQMKRTEVSSTSAGQFIYDRQSPAAPVNGYPLLVTSKVPRTLPAGTGAYSALIFGNFKDILLGVWDMVELIVNPYAKDTYGIVRVTIHHWVDIKIRHSESFATAVDIDTTVA